MATAIVLRRFRLEGCGGTVILPCRPCCENHPSIGPGPIVVAPEE